MYKIGFLYLAHWLKNIMLLIFQYEHLTFHLNKCFTIRTNHTGGKDPWQTELGVSFMGSDRVRDPAGLENICIWATHCTLDLGLGARGFRTGALPCFDVLPRGVDFLLDIVMLSKTLVVLGWPAGELDDFPAPDTYTFKYIYIIHCKCKSAYQ